MIVIKNISLSADEVDNHGQDSTEVRCMTFTGEDGAVIESVVLDLSQTLFPVRIHMEQVEGNVLSSTREGGYRARLPIPWLMDTGKYLLPIVVKDSAGNEGVATAPLQVNYRRPDNPAGVREEPFVRALEKTSGTRVLPASDLEFLEHGKQSLDRFLSLIRGAARQINLQNYTLGNQGAGRIIMDELVRKSSEGVEVNLLLNADTQYPTSPLGTLRLKLNEFLAEWTRREVKLPSPGQVPETLMKDSRQAGAASGISVVLFNGRTVGEAAGETRSETLRKAVTEQWLYRLLAGRKKDQEEKEASPGWLASFQGPGGLPALPLLDYAVHEKILVVDGEKAVVGGRNLEDQYFSRWNDLDLYLEGAIVGEIQKGFLRSFEEAAGPAGTRRPVVLLPREDKGREAIRCLFVQSRPWDREYRTILALVQAIQSCRKTLYATSQYLVLPDGLLHDALVDAARRGVDVRILMNSARTAEEVSLSTGYFLSLNYLGSLLEAGIRVWEKTGVPEENVPQPYLHAKEFIVDGELLAVGSFNLTLRSSYIESENLIFLWDRGLGMTRQRNFLARLGYEAREITDKRLAVLAREHKTRIEWSRYLELIF